MAFLVNNISELTMLKRIIGDEKSGDTSGDTLFLRLYDTDVTPAEGDSIGDYSESDGTGYAAIAVPGDTTGGAGWTYETGAGDTTSATFAQQTFTYSAGDTLYGYYITTLTANGDTVVFLSEKFTDGPYAIPSGGGTIKVIPRIELN